MIKICYVIGELSRHGAERQLYELVKSLDRETFDPAVITLSEGGYWSKEIRGLGVPVVELRRKRSREFARLFSLIRLFHRMRPDIVHTYMFSANTYGRVAAVLTGVPVIIASERNAAEAGKDKGNIQIHIDKLLSSFSDAIICNSARAASVLMKQYSFSPNKVFAVHNGITFSDYPTKGSSVSRRNSSHKVIGTVGRLFPQKNQRLFLDMAKMIIRYCPDRQLQFVIVGDGPLKDDLINYARTLGIDNHVVFTGERTDIPHLLRTMDIFVMTSDYEGLSNAIMEAMAAGLPVVATDVGGNGELIADGQTGYLCPSNDAGALAAAVVSLTDNEENAKEMGKMGRKMIMDEFGITKMVSETEKVYHALAAKKGISSSVLQPDPGNHKCSLL